jgi:hypothetical protein
MVMSLPASARPPAGLAILASLLCCSPRLDLTARDPGPAGGADAGGAREPRDGAAPGFGFAPHDGGPPGAAQTPPPENSCGIRRYHLERRPAELMLVLDRSGSMAQRPRGAATSKWTDTTGALDETIMKTSSAILWGLKMFPSGDVTCAVTGSVEVPSALDNFAPVTGAYAAAGPRGDGTPTAQAVRNTVAYLQATASPHPRYLVLATDGEPTCMDGLDGDLRDDAAAVQAVGEAAAAGFHTFVLGIATGSGATTVLDDMATAGLEPRAGTPRYYPVTGRQDLIDSLGLITGRISDCTFALEPPPPAPDDVAVDLGGQRLARDPTHASGWDYGADMKSIQIYGALCDQLRAGTTTDVTIAYGCPSVVIP